MKTISELQEEVIEEFDGLDDWMDRYAVIIDMGNALEPLDEAHKTPENLIDGCQSRVWVHATTTADGLLHIEADSDALIVKGIIAMLVRVLGDHTPHDILEADLHFIADIGLQDHLSPTRSNGLLAMLRRIRDIAATAGAAQNENIQ
ncbi:MAG: SufE family protein [Muribaculaceae bacterium]|nr:SufE family protein [Muribaculaceae bacterium]